MQSFYYSVVGLLAIIVHLILNSKVLKIKVSKSGNTEKYFSAYSISILFYFITDVLWGIVDFFGNKYLLYIDTVAYYIAMALSVVFCCRYVISFLNLNSHFAKFLKVFGSLFFLAECVVLIINQFIPVFFSIDAEGNYHAASYRYIALIIQIVMFAVITLISFVVALRKTGSSTRRNITICLFGLAMTVTIIVQTFYPFMPFYSIGLMLGICILHVFIQEDIKNEQYETLSSLASVFYSMHVIDLEQDIIEEISAINEVKQVVNRRHGSVELMKRVMNVVVAKDFLESALEFTDLTTVADRMQNKKLISANFIGNRVGWFLAGFIAMETDSQGKPTKVIFTTRVIDEEKRLEETLIRKTQTDEMTGLYNRRAYEEDIYADNDIPHEDNFVYVSIDVNSLKVVNDTLGHTAGDELIIGVCQCMKKSLGPYGKLYRIGGDEFVAIMFCDENMVKKVLEDFDRTTAAWSGKIIDSLSASYGYASKRDEPDASVRQLAAIAEKRMYKAKSAYYRSQGMDRRGQQDAHKALCESYTKILRINLTDDSYKIVNMDVAEQTADMGFADKISDWLHSFGKSGHVHSEDLDEYLKLTDLNFMREYFKSNKTSLFIFYRRKLGSDFKKVMMEIIPASDYTNENQSMYLYVKNIDR